MLNNAIEEELYMALDSLGYSKKEIDSMISKDELNSYSTLEEAIKGVLKKIQLRG
jgi:Holliday junction DNA helicase RuvA